MSNFEGGSVDTFNENELPNLSKVIQFRERNMDMNTIMDKVSMIETLHYLMLASS